MTEMVNAEGGLLRPRSQATARSWRSEPATLVAATLHQQYNKEGPAYQTVDAWVQEHGHQRGAAAGDLTTPDETPDPADYVTEIQFPIAEPA